MRRNPNIAMLYAIVCISALAPTAYAQSSNVEIYGRLNVTLERVHATSGDGQPSIGPNSRLANNRSVFGFRGKEELGNGLKAVWQIESAVSVDTGGGTVAGRDSGVGIEGPFGRILLGNWMTPYTFSTFRYDPFYVNTAGYMSLISNGSAPTSDHSIDTSSFDRRQRNSAQYWSPTWQGLSARVAYSASDDHVGSGRPHLLSIAGIYESGPLHLTLAHEQHKDYQVGGGTDRGTKLGAAYKFGDTRVAGVFERLEYETATGELRRNAWYVSLTRDIGAGTLKFGYAKAGEGKGDAIERVGFFSSGKDTGAQQYTLGYEHALSKRTALYGYYTRLDNESRGVYDFAINELGVGAGADLSGLALGLRHHF